MSFQTIEVDASRNIRRSALVGAAILVIVIGAFFVGRDQMPTTIRHGQALSALGSISAEVDDSRNYYIPIDVAWLDAGGAYHHDGRPECLPPVGTGSIAVAFATTKVKDPSGIERDLTIWVDCTGWNAMEDLTPEQAANLKIDAPTNQ